MTYIIGGPCIDVNDKSCVEECPVDCIYEGERKSYIQPDECIDCGACEPVCPVSAIRSDRAQAPEWDLYKLDSRRFFEEPLPGRDDPLGAPGGANKLGPVGVDTPLVAGADPE